MFELGFWEMVLVAVIALVVFGPEKLPQFARRAGYWIGRIRRQVNDVRNDIEREIAMDEIRRASEKLQAPLRGLADDIERSTARLDSIDVTPPPSPPAADAAPKQSS
jgi:sec-independent protein translocase protein TatB